MRYDRVLVKLSGGALAGSESSGFDPHCLDYIATELLKLHGMGLQLGVVVGGGNIFRGKLGHQWGIEQAEADNIGMLTTTRRGPERKGMTGPERAMLYRLAVETGFRAGELRSLIRSSFDLDGNPSTVTVAAAYSKRRREDTLPLRPELAQELQLFLAHMAPAVPVFKMPDRKQTGEMFRADIEATGIRY